MPKFLFVYVIKTNLSLINNYAAKPSKEEI